MNFRPLCFIAALALPGTTQAFSRAPFFDVNEWQKHPGGPVQDAFQLQDQVYEAEIEIDAVPTTRDKVPAFLRITDSSGKILEETKILIKLRGYTSFNFPKKQYGITLADDAGEEKSKKLLDLPKAEDWVLSAPYNDKSLVRDILAYNISNKIGRHAARTRIVNLTMRVPNRDPDRMGIYVLTEKNDIGKGRIDIPKKSDTATAYVAAFDHAQGDDVVLWSGRETDLILDYPKAEKITPEQLAAFMAIFNEVETRVATHAGESWEKIFDERIDLDSAVDFFLVQEFARNIDGFRLSSIFYIPPGGKVHFGPVWDFNIAFGNAEHENGVQAHGWRALEKGVWFNELFYHPAFCAAAKDRWTKLRADGSLSNDTAFRIIDQHTALMAPYADENFRRWPSLGRYLWPNPYWLDTWEEEKAALKSWISLRTDWLDKAVADWDCAINAASHGTGSSRPFLGRWRR